MDSSSSGMDIVNERKTTINTNHMDMCRFSNENDDGYVKFCTQALERFMNHVSIAKTNVRNY